MPNPLIDEPFRTLYVDPGEMTGWCIGKGSKLLGAGQTPMWEFIDDVWDAVFSEPVPRPDPMCPPPELGVGPRIWLREGVSSDDNVGRIGRIVCEDWKLYPDKLKALAWDQCRTARALGALKLIARKNECEYVLQPAAIKKRAMDGGAREFFYRPEHDNRHMNDAIMHYFFYYQTEMMGVYYSGLDTLPGKPEHDDD